MALDGGLIASGHFDGSLRFWDMRTGRLARELKQLHDQQICSVAVGLLGGAQQPEACSATLPPKVDSLLCIWKGTECIYNTRAQISGCMSSVTSNGFFTSVLADATTSLVLRGSFG